MRPRVRPAYRRLRRQGPPPCRETGRRGVPLAIPALARQCLHRRGAQALSQHQAPGGLENAATPFRRPLCRVRPPLIGIPTLKIPVARIERISYISCSYSRRIVTLADIVLLTGVSGFLGGHVAKALLAAGYQVRGKRAQPRQGRSGARRRSPRRAPTRRGSSFVALDLLKDDGWDERRAAPAFSSTPPRPSCLRCRRTRWTSSARRSKAPSAQSRRPEGERRAHRSSPRRWRRRLRA